MINYIYRVLKLHDFDDIEFTTGLGVNICFFHGKHTNIPNITACAALQLTLFGAVFGCRPKTASSFRMSW